jgi:hypothetical protein
MRDIPHRSRNSVALLTGCALLVCLGSGSSAAIQPTAHVGHAGEPLRPRVGLISNEVAVQRLRLAGVRNPIVVGRERGRILVQGTVRGGRALLSMDASSGVTVFANNPRRVVIPRGIAQQPQVRGRQVPVDRSRIADPTLMRGAEISR